LPAARLDRPSARRPQLQVVAPTPDRCCRRGRWRGGGPLASVSPLPPTTAAGCLLVGGPTRRRWCRRVTATWPWGRRGPRFGGCRRRRPVIRAPPRRRQHARTL